MIEWSRRLPPHPFDPLAVGGPHPLTAAIARMHPADHDIIDDFLLEVARRKLAVRGQLLDNLISRALNGTPPQPTNQDAYEKLPAELLKMAKKWQATGVIEIEKNAV